MNSIAWARRSLLALACMGATVALADGLDSTGVVEMAPPTPQRLYVVDPAFPHMIDGRMHIVDGDTERYLGVISTGYSASVALAPDRKEIYVATTYYARLNHGERTDVVDIHDAQTLSWKGEIVIPTRHAQAMAARNVTQTSFDGHYLFVQNATPATSVTVVDLKARKVIAEVQTPGCWSVYPSPSVAGRFSAMCGNGSMLTVTLDAAGQILSRRQSAPFFDPDKDPVFTNFDRYQGRYVFVSYHGQVHVADLSGEEAKFDAPWSLLNAADRKQHWRPGGYQLLATHEPSGRLFVTMHDKGEEGTHKDPAKEIWAFDLNTHQRVSRSPGYGAGGLAVSRGDKPRLYALNVEEAKITQVDVSGAKPRFLRTMQPIAETPIQLELQ
ncbi:amine dehydrogenase large subunit [Zoogloea sp.]|uniref:amine dehydrogenase large subunit n=1 Tax=Zoogloea sp. TaxID=49181 RepID=UPI0035AFD227